MAKIVNGSDVIPGCAEVLRGQDEQDVIVRVSEHAWKKHGFRVTPDVEERVRAVIQDVRGEATGGVSRSATALPGR